MSTSRAEGETVPDARPDSAGVPDARGLAPRPRGVARRDALVDAAVAIVLESGEAALTHRVLAARADLPLASTTYHFRTLDDILAEVGARLAAGWVAGVRAVRDDGATVASARGARRAEMLARALLPAGDDDAVRAHYEHLVAAGRTRLGDTYAASRAGLDEEIAGLLDELGIVMAPEVALALVDGAAVAALSEGRPVREGVVGVLKRVVST